MIKNIRHIQIKKIAYHPNLYKAILTYEDTEHKYKYDESDDIEYIKLKELYNPKWIEKNKNNKNYNKKI